MLEKFHIGECQTIGNKWKIYPSEQCWTRWNGAHIYMHHFAYLYLKGEWRIENNCIEIAQYEIFKWE